MKRHILIGLVALLLGAFGCEEAPPVQPILSLDGAPFLEVDKDSLSAVAASMPLERKLGQLLIYRQKGAPSEELTALVRQGLIGGVQFYDIRPTEFLHWREQLQQGSPNNVLIGLEGSGSYHAAFSDTEELPSWASWQSVGEDSLKSFAQQMAYQQLRHLRLDWAELPTLGEHTTIVDYSTLNLASYCSQRGILPIINGGLSSNFSLPDSSQQQLALIDFYARLISAGMAGIEVDISNQNEGGLLAIPGFIRQKLKYGGLLIANLENPQALRKAMLVSPDLIILDGSPQSAVAQMLSLSAEGLIDESWLNDKVARVLQAKTWITQNQPEQPVSKRSAPKVKTLRASLAASSPSESSGSADLDQYFYDESWAYWNQVVKASSLVLAANPQARVPITELKGRSFQIIHLGAIYHKAFDEMFGKYAAYDSWTAPDWKSVARLMERGGAITDRVLVLHDVQLDSTQAEALMEWAAHQQLILVNLNKLENLSALSEKLVIVQAFSDDDETLQLVPQLLFGGIPARGKLAVALNRHFPQGHGYETSTIRLRFGIAQQAGIAPQSLVGIDAIVNTAIEDKVFPGAQVMAVKDGNIIYHKSFGHHTYNENREVLASDLYDLASITKVAATGLAAMKAYEEGQYKLNGKLKNYLEESANSRLQYLTPKKLMSHRTGLQAHMPVVPYLLFRDKNNTDCSLFFCNHPSDTFPIQVADSFYFASQYYEKVWKDLYRDLKPRRTKYKYSDVNFVLVQRLLESQSGQRLDSMVYNDFYDRLGLRRTRFNPLRSIARRNIVPTQKDERWRYQLLQGYVHDETAALMGGVAGHAGLFSNTEELAVIFQMLLNGGQYGGQQFLKEETIADFTAADYGNHRGLTFDKPEKEEIKEGDFPKQATTAIYGHTGFTGGCVWADPDNDLIFIFLSNRVYPDAKNKLLFRKRIRERVHQVIYDALGTFEAALPRLET